MQKDDTLLFVLVTIKIRNFWKKLKCIFARPLNDVPCKMLFWSANYGCSINYQNLPIKGNQKLAKLFNSHSTVNLETLCILFYVKSKWAIHFTQLLWHSCLSTVKLRKKHVNIIIIIFFPHNIPITVKYAVSKTGIVSFDQHVITIENNFLLK